MGERLVAYGDLGWADFSEFDVTAIDLSGGASVEIPRNWQDVALGGVGLEYRLSPSWTLQTGLSYAGSPLKRRDRTPDLALDRQVRFGLGFKHQLSDDMEIGVSWEYLDLGSAKMRKAIAAGTLSGEYDSNRVQFLAFSLSRSF